LGPSESLMSTICEIQNASKTYGSGATLVYALKDCDFSLARGEFTALSGPSGSGKTTMLNLVGLLDVPSAGTVKVEGTDVSGLSNRELAAIRAKRIGFVFQSFNLIPVLTALVKEPALIIADEPTANLDSNTGSEILALMRKMNADHGTTFLFSTHDPMV